MEKKCKKKKKKQPFPLKNVAHITISIKKNTPIFKGHCALEASGAA